jgi:lipopolysaccharide transport system permease protein
MPDKDETTPAKVIMPGSSSLKEYLREMWRYRNFILVFAKQEFKVQYVQTRFNVLWVILRPLLVVAIFTFIFDKLIHINSLLYPYPLFAISGLIIWNNFSFMVNNAGNIITSNQQLIKKVYFPRLVLIVSKMLISLVELAVTFILLLILMLIWNFPIRIQILMAPVFIIIGLLTGTGIAVWLNALTIKYRDLHQFVPTLVGFMIWLTPVFYPVTLIPSRYSFILYINPVSGVIQGLR